MVRATTLVLACACASACARPAPSPVRVDAAHVVAPATAPVAAPTPPRPASAAPAPARASAAAGDLLRRGVTPIVDVAAARPPSAALPMGSAFVGAVTSELPGRALLVEWDIAGARVLRSVELDHAGDGALAVRVAATGDRVFAAVDHWPSARPVYVAAFDHDLRPLAERAVGAGTDLSLDASGEWVVVSTKGAAATEPLTVTLLSSRTLDARATAVLGATEMLTPRLRPRSVALHDGRVYVGARALTKTPPPRVGSTGARALPPITLYALDVPSLRVVATRPTSVTSQYPAFVTSRGGRLFAELGGELLELTRDLALVRARPFVDGPAAVGPAGGFAVARCLEPVQDAICPRDEPGTDETCAPAWPHDAPLLACGGGGGAMRIAPMR